MPRWLKDPQWWFVIMFTIIAASSLYNSYKLYQMTDGKAPVATKRR